MCERFCVVSPLQFNISSYSDLQLISVMKHGKIRVCISGFEVFWIDMVLLYLLKDGWVCTSVIGHTVLTPWSKLILWNFIGESFPTFHWTQRFCTVLKRSHHWNLPCQMKPKEYIRWRTCYVIEKLGLKIAST